ncbi:hypothetical protein [Chryseobacterium nepalense]|uniref:hypothetical protein n=1 Tax=Chryseobacterium nepalense TaxID=1854498 RepID=UPI002DFCDA76|nr:hypothetical protein [Chryseobacterium nepalense]
MKSERLEVGSKRWGVMDEGQAGYKGMFSKLPTAVLNYEGWKFERMNVNHKS